MATPVRTETKSVPFFRVALSQDEMDEVVAVLQAGWLTTGPRVHQFEEEFAAAVGAEHALAINSGTAALHLGVAALDLQPGQAVLVPTLTFAATAEVVRYMGAVPILVDCDPVTLNMDLADAERKLHELRKGQLPTTIDPDLRPVGMIPVHVGGLMMDVDAMRDFAMRHGLWIVEDAAHAFPAAWRASEDSPWRRCGENTASVTCYSFYANKTITTGEGGMAVTESGDLASRMRLLSLHGLSRDAWDRYRGGGWDYRIVAPGYKYNLTEIAAAIGLHQLSRAEGLRLQREYVAQQYQEAFADVPQLELPYHPQNVIHSWHLFPIRLQLQQLTIDRNQFVEHLREHGVGFSVHWRPLHLHPYYQDNFGWQPSDLPIATQEWARLISLPIFPGQQPDEIEYVIDVVTDACERFAR